MEATRLKKLPLFSDLPRRQRKVIAQHADEVDFPEGTKLVEEGHVAYELFVIVEGTADVLDGETKIAEMGPGDVVGEIGVLDTVTRTATVVATSPVSAIVMYAPEVRALDQTLPGVIAELRELGRRRLERHR
jgi:CRP-like cAMP-binding protein